MYCKKKNSHSQCQIVVASDQCSFADITLVQHPSTSIFHNHASQINYSVQPPVPWQILHKDEPINDSIILYPYALVSRLSMDFSTGLCNTDTKTGIFRRKSSTMRSRLASVQSSSCPASPREGMRAISSEGALGRMDHSATSASLASTSAGPSSTCVTGLQRSASTVSNYRPRSSPSGLYSYTGMVVFVDCFAIDYSLCILI